MLKPEDMTTAELDTSINLLLNERKRRRAEVLQQLKYVSMFLTDEQVTEVTSYINDNYTLEND